MVLNITRVIKLLCKLTFSNGLNSLDLGHNHFKGFSDNVGENIESTTMGHTNHELVSTIFNGGVNSHLQTGNEWVTALKTESLLSIELLGHESTEVVGPLKTIV